MTQGGACLNKNMNADPHATDHPCTGDPGCGRLVRALPWCPEHMPAKVNGRRQTVPSGTRQREVLAMVASQRETGG